MKNKKIGERKRDLNKLKKLRKKKQVKIKASIREKELEFYDSIFNK